MKRTAAALLILAACAGAGGTASEQDCLTIAIRTQLPAEWNKDVQGVLDDLRDFGFHVRENGPDPITIAFGTTAHPDYAGEAYGHTIVLNPDTEWKHGWVDEHVPGEPRDRTRIAFAKTLAHEIGHALGLPHVDDMNEVMHPGAWASRWGPRTSARLRATACA